MSNCRTNAYSPAQATQIHQGLGLPCVFSAGVHTPTQEQRTPQQRSHPRQYEAIIVTPVRQTPPSLVLLAGVAPQSLQQSQSLQQPVEAQPVEAELPVAEVVRHWSGLQ